MAVGRIHDGRRNPPEHDSIEERDRSQNTRSMTLRNLLQMTGSSDRIGEKREERETGNESNGNGVYTIITTGTMH